MDTYCLCRNLCRECKFYDITCGFDNLNDLEIDERYSMIKDVDIFKNTPIHQPNSLEETIESMAYEIAKHRYPNKYEYDEELINSIIKEFS